jgi:hypothetical protein
VRTTQGQVLEKINSYFGSSDNLLKTNIFSESGSVYFSGEFSGKMIIGTNSLDADIRNAVYMGKQFPNGSMSVLKFITGSGALSVASIALKGDSIVAVGTFSDSLFTEKDTIVNEGFKAGYMIILDTLGSFLDVWHLPSYSAELFDVNVSSEGDILLCGEFYNQMIIGEQTFIAPLGFNFFLTKLDPVGLQPYWVRISEGTATNARSVGSDKNGNVYITGSYGNGTLVDGQVLPEVKGDHNMFVASFSSEGILNWIKAIVSPVQVHGLSQYVLEDGSIYVGGEFEFILDMDHSTTYSSQSLMDAFIAKLDKNGVLLWSGVISGKDNDKVSDISADDHGNPIVLINGGSLVYSSVPISTESFRSPVLLKFKKENGEMLWQYRIPAALGIGIVEGYSVDWNGGYLTLCGSNRTGIFYLDEILDSPNFDDSFRAIVRDTLFVEGSLGLKESDSDHFVELYPNPASDGFVVRSFQNNTIYGIEFYDSRATLVKEIRLNSGHFEFDGVLQTGVYVVKISCATGVHVRRLIIL